VDIWWRLEERVYRKLARYTKETKKFLLSGCQILRQSIAAKQSFALRVQILQGSIAFAPTLGSNYSQEMQETQSIHSQSSEVISTGA